MFQWKSEGKGNFSGRLPGLFLGIGASHIRFECTNRFGWSVFGEDGKLISSSPMTRHSSVTLAMSGAIRWVKQYRPEAWQAAMAAAGEEGG